MKSFQILKLAITLLFVLNVSLLSADNLVTATRCSNLNTPGIFIETTGKVVGAKEKLPNKINQLNDCVLYKYSSSWEKLNSGTNESLYSVFFTDINKGCAVGSNGTVLLTKDGGKTWNKKVIDPTYTLSSVYFTDSNTGFIVGHKDSISSVAQYEDGVYKGMIGVNGLILKTSDGGITWDMRLSGTSWLQSVCFFNENIGYAVGLNSSVVKTLDGGKSWKVQKVTEKINNATNAFSSVFSPDLNICWIGGQILNNNTLYAGYTKTIDGGTTWEVPQYWPALSGYTNSIFFLSSTYGYAVTSSGYIIYTDDGGDNWYSSLKTTNNLHSIIFITANTAYVVGSNGVILKTIDQAQNWNAETTGTTNSLYSIHFPDQNIGYAVGYSGTILKYNNSTNANILISDKIRIYPNPVKDKLMIEGIVDPSNVEIYDLNGCLLLTKQISPSESISVSLLPPGIYIVKITSKTETIKQKLVKQ